MSGPIKGRSKKGRNRFKSLSNARKRIKEEIHSIPAPAAAFAVVVASERGGKTDAFLQGELSTIVAGLRALGKANPKFQQALKWASMPDPAPASTDIPDANPLNTKTDESD